MVFQILNMLNSSLARCGQYFTTILNSSGMVGIFFTMLFIAMLFKFVISPFIGVATFTAASDSVRELKESSRRKGKYERNQRGKYSR